MTSIQQQPELLEALPGKTVIITGGANGIGAQTARLFNKHGANIVIADLPTAQPAAEALISTLPTESKTKSLYVPTNILDWQSMTNLFKITCQAFGRVDIVVANAGMMETRTFYDEEDIDENGDLKEPREAYRVIDVNLKGTMNTIRLAMHHMRNNPQNPTTGSRGSIVLVSSTSGYFGGTAVVSYVASKHGITGLLRSSQLAASRQNINLNAVAPFFTPTHITSNFAQQWKAAGLPANTVEDVAWAVAQTASDASLRGRCCLIAGSVMKEVEGPREGLVREWMGGDVADLMAGAGKLFESLGGYPLPNDTRS